MMSKLQYIFTFLALFLVQFVFAQNIQFCPSNSTPGSDFCQGACIYCDLNGYQGSTAGYTSQTPPGFCGTIENEQWFGFIAHTDTLRIIGTASNCSDGNGIQLAIYPEGCTSTPIACEGGTGGNNNTPLTVTAITVPGTRYLLMVDGFAGDQCDFILSTIPGNGTNGASTDSSFLVAGAISGPDSVCSGGIGAYTLDSVAGANFFYWNGPAGTTVNGQPVPAGISGASGTSYIIQFPFIADSATITVTPANLCTDTTSSQVLSKTIYPRQAPELVLPDTVFCGFEFVTSWGLVVNQTGTYYGNISSQSGCDTVVSQHITGHIMNPIVSEFDTVLCKGQSLTVCGQTYDSSGYYTAVCKSWLGCDSTVYFALNYLDDYALILGGIDLPACMAGSIQLESYLQFNQGFLAHRWKNINGQVLSSQPQFTPTQPGLYIHEVSALFSTGICTAADTIEYGHVQLFQSIDYQQVYNCVTQTLDVTAIVDPQGVPYTYVWSGPNGFTYSGETASIPESGIYQLTVFEPGDSCSLTFNLQLAVTPLPLLVTGKVYIDLDQDCQLDASDQTAPVGSLLRLENIGNPSANENAYIDSNGEFAVSLSPGTYVVNAQYPYANCPKSFVVPDCGQIADPITVLLNDVSNCPKLEASIFTPQVLNCSGGWYSITISNVSAQPQPNVEVELDLDPQLTYLDATQPLVSAQGQKVTFNLGYLNGYESRSFIVDFFCDCDALLGQEHCSKVTALPYNPCQAYQGPQLEVEGACQGDSVQFVVTNTGMGDMTSPQFYFWFAEDSLGQTLSEGQGNISLSAGQTQTFTLPANAYSVSFIAEQSALYPYSGQAGLQIIGCNQPNSLPIVSPLGMNEDQHVATNCENNVGSHDPNDKRGIPTGLGTEHYIALGSDLDYVIRFQNTGTAPAFHVIIRDTLPPSLNPYSARIGSMSHYGYMTTLPGNVIEFTFPGILLPDSTSNEPESHGFVTFHISQVPGNPEGIKIENSAAIYFDQNDPVITNQTLHTNGIPRPLVRVHEPEIKALQVYPNPFADQLQISLDPALPVVGTLVFELFDAFGKLADTQQFSGRTLTYRNAKLSSGMYFGKITRKSDGEVLAVGKLVKR